MTSTKENTKDLSQFQLANLLETGRENLLEEILQLGLQQLMELERDQHIDADPQLARVCNSYPFYQLSTAQEAIQKRLY